MEEQINDGYGIVTARLLDDERLSAVEKLFYIRITMLSMERGYCFASNEYLCGKMNVHRKHVPRMIRQLTELNYVLVRFVEKESGMQERRIYPILLQKQVLEKLLFASGYDNLAELLEEQNLQGNTAQVTPSGNPKVTTPGNPRAEEAGNPTVTHNSISNTNNISIEVVLSESDTETPDPAPTKKPKSFEEKYAAFIALFNNLTARKFKGCDKSKRNFKARLKAGYTAKEFTAAITAAYNSEHHRENNHTYLTPEFITRSDKLEMYLASSNGNGNSDTRGTAAAGQKLSYSIADKLKKQTAQR